MPWDARTGGGSASRTLAVLEDAVLDYTDSVAGDALWSQLANGATPTMESFPRILISVWSAAFTTGSMGHTMLPLVAGDVVTSLTFYTGTTGAGTPTNWWFALYDTAATPALMDQSADQTTTPIAAQTKYTLNLATPQTITVTGRYYACFMVKATTTPTWAATGWTASITGGILASQERLCGFSGSGLTTTAPGTIASPSNAGTIVYAAAL
jgi:hypothetical protein